MPRPSIRPGGAKVSRPSIRLLARQGIPSLTCGGAVSGPRHRHDRRSARRETCGPGDGGVGRPAPNGSSRSRGDGSATPRFGILFLLSSPSESAGRADGLRLRRARGDEPVHGLGEPRVVLHVPHVLGRFQDDKKMRRRLAPAPDQGLLLRGYLEI